MEAIASMLYGSSPLARGTRNVMYESVLTERLIPARAGNTLRTAMIMASVAAHPRSRGEHFRVIDAVTADIGSSPLARGTRAFNPAWPVHLKAHPRSRGEH